MRSVTVTRMHLYTVVQKRLGSCHPNPSTDPDPAGCGVICTLRLHVASMSVLLQAVRPRASTLLPCRRAVSSPTGPLLGLLLVDPQLRSADVPCRRGRAWA